MDVTELQRVQATKNVHRHPWEIVRAGILIRLFKKQAARYQHIADIGSGDAYVLGRLADKELANRYTAIDEAYTPAIVSQIQEQAPSTSSFFFLTSIASAATTTCDAAMLADVLEHCADDKAVLQEALTLLKPGGTLVITVPAYQFLFSGHDRLLLHYRRYNRSQLLSLCRSVNLDIKESGYFFSTLLIPRLVQSGLEKLQLRKTHKSIDNWNGGRPLSILFSTILWLDYGISRFFALIGLKLPGLSCYCVCKKQPL